MANHVFIVDPLVLLSIISIFFELNLINFNKWSPFSED